VTATQGYAEGAPSFRVWSGGGYKLPEGTRWLGDHLVFTDILARRAAGRPGTWIAAAGTGIALVGADGALTWLDRPEDLACPDADERRLLRPRPRVRQPRRAARPYNGVALTPPMGWND
jgi:hypothetical protein